MSKCAQVITVRYFLKSRLIWMFARNCEQRNTEKNIEKIRSIRKNNYRLYRRANAKAMLAVQW